MSYQDFLVPMNDQRAEGRWLREVINNRQQSRYLLKTFGACLEGRVNVTNHGGTIAAAWASATPEEIRWWILKLGEWNFLGYEESIKTHKTLQLVSKVHDRVFSRLYKKPLRSMHYAPTLADAYRSVVTVCGKLL